MTLKKYLFFMAIIAVFCWAAWVVVLFSINPEVAGFLGLFFFYLTLFFALTTSFAVLGLALRRLLVRQDLAVRQVAVALRQGLLFSLLLVGSLILVSLSLLTWWLGLILVAFLSLLEFLFLSFSKDNQQAE
ncbi:MAG: hypothetical protein WCT37_00385 [Patescibacteria group bacterium]|jgi:hypothetical protein